MCAALHAKLPEVWIAPQPILLYMYLAQYAPSLFTSLSVKAGQKRVEAFAQGKTGYDSIQSVWGVISASGKAAAAAEGKKGQ